MPARSGDGSLMAPSSPATDCRPGGPKLVRVFRAAQGDARPRIVDTRHVAGLEYHTVEDVGRAIHDDPDAFTATFRRVFVLFTAVRE